MDFLLSRNEMKTEKKNLVNRSEPKTPNTSANYKKTAAATTSPKRVR